MTREKPPLVHEHEHEKEHDDASTTCPFCMIVKSFPPIDPLQQDQLNSNSDWNPQKLSPPAYALLATEHVVAFMDIAPLTRGHVLVSPRKHRIKMGDLTPEEMSEIGKVLPVVARAVIKAVLPDIPHSEADYNIVQNNGPGAAQVVPHVHFHIVPRPPLDYRPPPSNERSSRATTGHLEQTSQKRRSNSTSGSGVGGMAGSSSASRYSPAKIPTGLQRSYIQFGRGMRHELDEDDASVLVEDMRACIQAEWRASFGALPAAGAHSIPDLDQTASKAGPQKAKPQKL